MGPGKVRNATNTRPSERDQRGLHVRMIWYGIIFRVLSSSGRPLVLFLAGDLEPFFPPIHLSPRKNGYIAIFPPSLSGGGGLLYSKNSHGISPPPLQVGGKWLYSGFSLLNVISNLL